MEIKLPRYTKWDKYVDMDALNSGEYVPWTVADLKVILNDYNDDDVILIGYLFDGAGGEDIVRPIEYVSSSEGVTILW